MGSSTRQSEELFTELVGAGVLEAPGSDTIVRTERFQEAVKDYRRQLSSDDFESEWVDVFASEEIPVDDRETVAARAHAVECFVADLEREEVAAVAVSLRRFEVPVRSEEVPERFTPLVPIELDGFCSQHPCSVVVFWKEGDGSSKSVFEDFVDLSNESEFEDVGFGAVHAPDFADTVREQFSIGILPTVLFFIGNRIDSRLVGPHHSRTFERELSIVVERGSDGAE